VYAVNRILILLGLLVSIGVSIFAAQPWGDNYAYQDITGYLMLFAAELWICAPFVGLYFLNRAYRYSPAHKKVLLISCVIGSVLVSVLYVNGIVFSSGSTSALIFLFMPIYQLVFIFVVLVISQAMSRWIKSTQE
jgi:drug/metabolite transporter (DMT)-like permease